MKNIKRSKAYLKIKRTINSCRNMAQLSNALNLIALHRNIKESDALFEIYNEKNKQFVYAEDDTLTSLHRATCGAQ